MKIQLNENEQYEIKLPDVIDINELPMIVSRFNVLLKSFSKFSSVNSNELALPKRTYNLTGNNSAKSGWDFLRENREVFVEILKAHYNKTPEEFEDLKSNYDELANFKRNYLHGTSFVRYREVAKITPEEVGLIRFPSLKEKAKFLRINNTEIKSEEEKNKWKTQNLETS